MWPHEKLKRKEKKTITTNNKQGIRWWEEWELAYSQEQKQSCHTPPKKNIFLRSDGPKCVRATLARMCQSLKGPLMKEMAEAWPPKNTSIFLGGWASLGTVFVCVCVGGGDNLTPGRFGEVRRTQVSLTGEVSWVPNSGRSCQWQTLDERRKDGNQRWIKILLIFRMEFWKLETVKAISSNRREQVFVIMNR